MWIVSILFYYTEQANSNSERLTNEESKYIVFQVMYVYILYTNIRFIISRYTSYAISSG